MTRNCIPVPSPRAGRRIECRDCKQPMEEGQIRLCRTEPCIYRREPIRLEVCEPCGGSVRLKIFSCDLHGECTLANLAEDVMGVRCCIVCDDYSL